MLRSLHRRIRTPMLIFWSLGLTGMLTVAVAMAADRFGFSAGPAAVAVFFACWTLALCVWGYMVCVKFLMWIGVLEDS